MKFLVVIFAIFAAFVNAQSDKQVFCYFSNWAWERQGIGKYTPDDIDANLCTHILYAFAILNETTMEIQSFDAKTDIDNQFYERVTAYRSQGIKVVLSIGGWSDSAGATKYGRLLTDKDAKNTFIESVFEFLEKYKFDGLDFDLEYPGCWQGNCQAGNSQEVEGFVKLLQELSPPFKKKGFLLTAAVAAGKKTIDSAYDIPEMVKCLDYINLMTYDYHGSWDSQTGHVAPLYSYPGDKFDYINVDFSVNYWIQKGAPPEKLILGFPLYGKSFTLENVQNNGINAASSGNGNAGTFSGEAGTLSFYEICNNTKNNGWTVVRDSKNRIGPYAYKGDQWVSYDDIDTIAIKIEYLKNMGLGGAMIWALDLDDFTNSCGCGKSPLLTKINHDLGRNVESNIEKCT